LVRDEDVKEGDLVVTSGRDGAFPRDIPVGRVKKIEKSEYGIYQEVEVEPAVDFPHLHTVLVVLSPPPPPDPAVKQRKAEPAFGAQVYK
jgi:rod shape-determining protein MreC